MNERSLGASNAYCLDTDFFPDLLAAVALRALRDVMPSQPAAQRAEAEEFLTGQFSNWRALQTHPPPKRRVRKQLARSPKARQKSGKSAATKQDF